MSSLKNTPGVHCEQISGYFMKEPMGFFHNVPSGHFDGFFYNVPNMCLMGMIRSSLWVFSQRTHSFTHWVFGGQIDGSFHKILSMNPLGIMGTNYTRTHNIPTMYLLGK